MLREICSFKMIKTQLHMLVTSQLRSQFKLYELHITQCTCKLKVKVYRTDEL